MARKPRKQSESNIYHVFSRGAGHQLIFEDDRDRIFFLNTLGNLLIDSKCSLLAWALMGNHFHLLLHMQLDALSDCMRRLQSIYAQYYNRRYDHVGHLFQGRFGSQPIDGDEQLIECVRYIHKNPVKAGISNSCDYKWSSYRGYIQGATVTDTNLVLEMIGGTEPFIELHQSEDDARFSFIDVDNPTATSRTKRLSDDKAKELAEAILGAGWEHELPNCQKAARDARLSQLKEAGLSVLQIERLTGIGRNIINRA